MIALTFFANFTAAKDEKYFSRNVPFFNYKTFKADMKDQLLFQACNDEFEQKVNKF